MALSGVKGLSVGFFLGATLVLGGLPEKEFIQFRQQVFVPVTAWARTCYEFAQYYKPTQVNKRKHEEAVKNSWFKADNSVQLPQDTAEDKRRRIQLHSEIQARIRRAEILATQRGLTLRERKDIINQTLGEFYPELDEETTQKVIQQTLDEQTKKPKKKRTSTKQ